MTTADRLHHQIEGIQSKEDLVRFLHDLTENDPTSWENPTLERFLDALARWLEDSDWYYKNAGLDVPRTPSWKSIAEMLLAATMYE
jgi:hypothetical protein